MRTSSLSTKWSVILVPVLVLESVGAGPVELERGGTLVLAFGFFSMSLGEEGLRPSFRERAAELSSIKRDKKWKKRDVTRGAGQATKALVHVCQSRILHYGDILTTKQTEKKIQETPNPKCLQKKIKKTGAQKKRGINPGKGVFPLVVGTLAPRRAFSALQLRENGQINGFLGPNFR